MLEQALMNERAKSKAAAGSDDKGAEEKKDAKGKAGAKSDSKSGMKPIKRAPTCFTLLVLGHTEKLTSAAQHSSEQTPQFLPQCRP